MIEPYHPGRLHPRERLTRVPPRNIEALSTMNDAKGVMARFIAQGIRMRRRGRRREKRRKREKKTIFYCFIGSRITRTCLFINLST